MDDQSGATIWSYSNLGRNVSETRVVDGVSGNFQFAAQSDWLGRVSQLTYADGEVVSYTYDGLGRTNGMTGSVSGNLATLAYNALSQIEGINLGNGVFIDNTYSATTHRLIGRKANNGTTDLIDFSYQYDDAGNITSIIDSVMNENFAYTYDHLNRLLSADATTNSEEVIYRQKWNYDSLGNILQASDYVMPEPTAIPTNTPIATDTPDPTITPTVTDTPTETSTPTITPTATNTPAPFDGSYGYDANGNMVTRTEFGVTWTQVFNAENRLASLSSDPDGEGGNPPQTWSFVYDGDGNRVKQVNPDGSISLFLGGGSYEVRDAAGSPQVLKYYAVAGQRLAMMDGTTTRYLLTDHLGSVVAILDDSGNLVNAQEQRYMPFGEERFAGGITETDFGYTGQRALEAVGLMDYNARFYDAALGRFMSADNLVIGAWNPQAFNRYAYVSNNPVNYADPTGHWMVEDEGGDKLGCSLKKYCDEDYKAQPIKPSVRRTEKPGVRRLEKPAVGGLEKPGSQWSEKPKSNTPSWVAGVSGTGCIAPNCAAAGLEVLGRKDPMGKDDDYAIYDYSGWGSGGIGLASFSLYGGPVWNVKDPSDYAGKFNSVGFNVSLGDFGLTGSYFWQGDTENPFEAGIVKGFVIGYSPGAQISGWQMITDYTERFSDWD